MPLGSRLSRRRGRAGILLGLAKCRRPGQQAKHHRDGTNAIPAHAASYRYCGEYRLNGFNRRLLLPNS
jgi:hypothetical protein